MSHLAHCPEVDPVTCATIDIPVHTHQLRTDHARVDLGLAVGIGRGWQVALDLPAEARVVQVDYSTLDGASFDPPYADIHHRDETLAGLADGELTALRSWRAEQWVLGAEGGATLPLGRTEDDPFEAASRGEWHEHNQLGAGVPLAILRGSATRSPAPWGAQVSIGGRVSALENARGYQAPTTLSLAAGPTRRVKQRTVVIGALALVRDGREVWNGTPHAGRTAALGQVAVEWAPTGAVSLALDVRVPVWQRLDEPEQAEADEDGQLILGPRLALGVALTRNR